MIGLAPPPLHTQATFPDADMLPMALSGVSHKDNVRGWTEGKQSMRFTCTYSGSTRGKCPAVALLKYSEVDAEGDHYFEVRPGQATGSCNHTHPFGSKPASCMDTPREIQSSTAEFINRNALSAGMMHLQQLENGVANAHAGHSSTATANHAPANAMHTLAGTGRPRQSAASLAAQKARQGLEEAARENPTSGVMNLVQRWREERKPVMRKLKVLLDNREDLTSAEKESMDALTVMISSRGLVDVIKPDALSSSLQRCVVLFTDVHRVMTFIGMKEEDRRVSLDLSGWGSWVGANIGEADVSQWTKAFLGLLSFSGKIGMAAVTAKPTAEEPQIVVAVLLFVNGFTGELFALGMSALNQFIQKVNFGKPVLPSSVTLDFCPAEACGMRKGWGARMPIRCEWMHCTRRCVGLAFKHLSAHALTNDLTHDLSLPGVLFLLSWMIFRGCRERRSAMIVAATMMELVVDAIEAVGNMAGRGKAEAIKMVIKIGNEWRTDPEAHILSNRTRWEQGPGYEQVFKDMKSLMPNHKKRRKDVVSAAEDTAWHLEATTLRRHQQWRDNVYRAVAEKDGSNAAVRKRRVKTDNDPVEDVTGTTTSKGKVSGDAGSSEGDEEDEKEEDEKEEDTNPYDVIYEKEEEVVALIEQLDEMINDAEKSAAESLTSSQHDSRQGHKVGRRETMTDVHGGAQSVAIWGKKQTGKRRRRFLTMLRNRNPEVLSQLLKKTRSNLELLSARPRMGTRVRTSVASLECVKAVVAPPASEGYVKAAELMSHAAETESNTAASAVRSGSPLLQMTNGSPLQVPDDGMWHEVASTSTHAKEAAQFLQECFGLPHAKLAHMHIQGAELGCIGVLKLGIVTTVAVQVGGQTMRIHLVAYLTNLESGPAWEGVHEMYELTDASILDGAVDLVPHPHHQPSTRRVQPTNLQWRQEWWMLVKKWDVEIIPAPASSKTWALCRPGPIGAGDGDFALVWYSRPVAVLQGPTNPACRKGTRFTQARGHEGVFLNKTRMALTSGDTVTRGVAMAGADGSREIVVGVIATHEMVTFVGLVQVMGRAKDQKMPVRWYEKRGKHYVSPASSEEQNLMDDLDPSTVLCNGLRTKASELGGYDRVVVLDGDGKETTMSQVATVEWQRRCPDDEPEEDGEGASDATLELPG